jgi:hypothetical protein
VAGCCENRNELNSSFMTPKNAPYIYRYIYMYTRAQIHSYIASACFSVIRAILRQIHMEDLKRIKM